MRMVIVVGLIFLMMIGDISHTIFTTIAFLFISNTSRLVAVLLYTMPAIQVIVVGYILLMMIGTNPNIQNQVQSY